MAPSEARRDTSAIGLDLGSTSFKAGRLGAGGRLESVTERPAPSLTGREEIREGDPARYATTASELLAEFFSRH